MAANDERLTVNDQGNPLVVHTLPKPKFTKPSKLILKSFSTHSQPIHTHSQLFLQKCLNLLQFFLKLIYPGKFCFQFVVFFL